MPRWCCWLLQSSKRRGSILGPGARGQAWNPSVELKQLPPGLQYVFLNGDHETPVIISNKLTNDDTRKLISTLEKYQSVIGYSLKDLKGISPSLYTHHIPIEQEHKPIHHHQWRLNNVMREVVRKEVLKLLKAGVIYPIPDSEWVSPVQVVPKKVGMAVICNEKNELIPQWTVTSWQMCITYRKLSKATRKDHFLLPFIDEMLEKLPTTPSTATWNGGKRPTTVLTYIKKEPKVHTTSESRSSNSSREIRYFSLYLVFIYLVTVSFVVSGKVLA
jgi:hypothetical protein